MKLNEYLAHMIVRRTTARRFSTLHADFLEQQMSETTNSMNVKNSDVPVSVKQTGYKTLEGSNPGDHRPQAADAVLPSNPPVRGETEQAGS
jgi:hypothetical protein